MEVEERKSLTSSSLLQRLTSIPGNAILQEIASLRNHLSREEAEESKVLEELKRVQGRIEILRKQKAALESKIATIWTLPVELLSYIFEIGAELDIEDEENEEKKKKKGKENSGSEFDSDSDKPPPTPFVILVSHVCSTFRNVALRTSSLWTTIILSHLRDEQMERARAFVERSGTSPLTIFYEEEDGSDELRDTLMDLLHPHISRLKAFSIRLSSFRSIHRIMLHLDKPAPLLEYLELNERDYDTGFDEFEAFEHPELAEPLTVFSGHMPKLKELILDGVHVAWPNCNFHDLRELVLGYHTRDVRPTYEDFKAIIDGSPDLKCLTLRGSGPILPEEADVVACYPPLEMERLESLDIADIASEYLTPLILLLRAPNLRSLSLIKLNTNDYTTFLLTLADPPVLYPNVTELKLLGIDGNTSAFTKLFRAYPNLKKLSLYIEHENERWLTCIAPEDGSEVPCQKLEMLRCFRAPLHDVHAALTRRQAAGCPIPKVEMDHSTAGWGNDDVMDWIKQNTDLEIISEPSENGLYEDDEDEESEWGSDGGMHGLGPWFLDGGGFSDEDEDEDEDEEEDAWIDEDSSGSSDMEVDDGSSDESGSDDGD